MVIARLQSGWTDCQMPNNARRYKLGHIFKSMILDCGHPRIPCLVLLLLCSSIASGAEPAEKPPAPILVGGFRTLAEDEYLGTLDFREMDAKLRKQNDLAGYDVARVDERVAFGKVYRLVYSNKQGATATFQVFVAFRQMEVLNERQGASVDPKLAGSLVQTQIQYLRDKQIASMDMKLRRQADNDLTKYYLNGASSEPGSNGTIFDLSYVNQVGKVIEFRLSISNAEIQILKKGTSGASDQTSKASVSYVFNKAKRTAEEIKRTKQFKVSLAELLKQYRHFLVDAEIVEISMKENDESVTYNIVQKTASGMLLAVVQYQLLDGTVKVLSLVAINPSNIREAAL